MPALSMKELAAIADEFEATREQRLALDKKAAALKKKEVELQNILIDNISKADATGVAGKTVRVSVVTEDVPVIEDREAFRKYINRTKHFELMQALKPAAAAIKERWEQGKPVPGIGKFTKVKLSRSKL